MIKTIFLYIDFLLSFMLINYMIDKIIFLIYHSKILIFSTSLVNYKKDIFIIIYNFKTVKIKNYLISFLS